MSEMAFRDVSSLQGAQGEAQEEVAAWIGVLSRAEGERLKLGGAERVLPLSCSAFCTNDAGSAVWNRIEVITQFDFDRVRQILVSDPQPCPHKEFYLHVHVILQIDSQDLSALCLLLPYLYDHRNKRNTLKNWSLVNSNGKESRHRIDAFTGAQ